MIISGIFLFFIISALLVGERKPNISSTYPVSVPTSTPSPTIFISPSPIAPQTSMRAKLIYPLASSVIKETRPTIIGRITQSAHLLLPYEYKEDNFIHYV